jgi:hypothetical protein
MFATLVEVYSVSRLAALLSNNDPLLTQLLWTGHASPELTANPRSVGQTRPLGW